MSHAMQAQDLRVSLDGREVLHGIDLCVSAGRWTCVLGPNGAGKSTLLQALAGLLPSQGPILWQGRPLASLSRHERSRQLSWLGQSQAQEGLLQMRVYDVAMLGRLPHQSWLAGPSAQDHAVVQSALQATQAWAWRERSMAQLSGGERQRVLLARTLAVQAPLVLMDEPLAHLDPPHQVDWLEQVQCLKAQGCTVLSVLHDIGMALHADELVVLAQGRRLHHGPSHAPSTHRAIEAVFEHRIRIVPVTNAPAQPTPSTLAPVAQPVTPPLPGKADSAANSTAGHHDPLPPQAPHWLVLPQTRTQMQTHMQLQTQPGLQT